MTDKLSQQLFYQFQGERVILPEWADFFVRLGLTVAQHPNTDNNLCVVLSVPTRILAAPLVASGLVLGRALQPVTNQGSLGYFRFLSSLPPGTHLSFLRPGGQRRIIGTFEPVEGADGGTHLRIRVRDAIYKKPASSAGTIFVTSEDTNQTGMRGRKIVRDGMADLMSFLKPDAYQSFMLQSRLDCMLIGPKNTIEEEIRHSSFFASEDGASFQISDLLRVKSLLSPHSPFRSEIIAPNTKEFKILDEQPFATILDGPLALRKRVNRCQNCHRIVILGRASHGLEETMGIIQQEYITQRLDGNPVASLPVPPYGIEMLAYETKA